MDAIAQLYAEVYAHPDDDQLRRVLADALLAANDPRGELILFQLEPDKDYHRRAMRLVQAHGLSWLGPLRGIVIPLAYERGFLASCQVIAPNPEPCAEWATVHTIEVASPGFRLHPEMRSLRHLRLDDDAWLLDQLATRDRAALAALDIQLAWTEALHGVLARQLRGGVGRRLAIEGVPEDRAPALRVLGTGSPTVLDLRIAPPPVVHDHYDAIEE